MSSQVCSVCLLFHKADIFGRSSNGSEMQCNRYVPLFSSVKQYYRIWVLMHMRDYTIHLGVNYGIYVSQMVCSTCRKHFPVLSSFMTYHYYINQTNTTGVTSGTKTRLTPRVSLVEFTPGISGVRIARPLVVCACFVDCCLTSSPFSFDHCVFCPSIYGFLLPLWYFQILLKVMEEGFYCCSTFHVHRRVFNNLHI